MPSTLGRSGEIASAMCVRSAESKELVIGLDVLDLLHMLLERLVDKL